MTPGRWTLWLVAMGAGTCIALSAGSAVALADTADSGPPSDHGTSQDATSGSDAGTSDKADDKAEAAKSSSKDEPEDDAGTDSVRDDDRPSASHSGDTKGADKYGTDPDGATQDDDHDASATTDDEPATQPDTSVTAPPAVDTDTITAPTKAQDPLQALATMATNFWSSLGVAPAVARPAPTAEPVAAATTVSGVRTGHSTLTIPVGDKGFNTNADWYFPTQADGSVSATGVIWLQHGFLSDKSWRNRCRSRPTASSSPRTCRPSRCAVRAVRSTACRCNRPWPPCSTAIRRR